MMLTIHGLPVMVKYHELKALIKKECNMSDFILDNLVNDLDGYKKVRIGVADETEGSHLTKCLNGYHLGGNVLRVVPLSKPLANQPQSNFDQRGGYIPDQSGNFGNQPMMGNRSTPWGPSGQNQWAPNQQQPNQMPQNNFAYQQGPNNQPFAQQQQPMPQRGQPTPKPFTQTGSYNQNRPTPPFGSANNVSVPVQAQRRNERSHVLRNVELVSEPPRPQTVNRFPQDSYEQNKPPQKPSPFDKGPQFDDKRHEKGRFSPPRGPHDRRPSAGRDLRSPGRRSPGRRSPGRRSPGRRPSPGDRRLPPRKSPGRRDSPKRMSPNRRLESPGRRYSPSRRPDKGYDRGSQSKQVRPAYEPDGKAPNQAMYSGGYRPSPHESGPYSGRPNQQNSPWQQDRDKYPGQMKKPDDDRRDSRMAGGARGPEPLEANRPSPMHKSRSPSRRDVRERSPLRDRYKRHSPSPRSPRRSWALEKRRSPELTQAPPPPMWPGQNEEDSYGRDKVEGSKHVPVWDHRTLAETEEAMRRDNRAYADERMRREVASRDAPARREPSPRRHGFKPHEEVFSAKINTEPKFEPRDPKFLPRESKFDSRDPKFDQRDSKFAPRDPMFNQRDPKYDQRDPKFEPRDPKFDPRAPKFEPRDPKFQPRDPKFEPRDPKFEPRDPKFEPRDPKFEPRDPKFDPREPKFEPRDPKFQPRDPKFEPRDPKFDPRGPKFEPRDPKFEPRDPKFDQRDKFELRDPKFDSRDHHFEARDQRKMGPSQQNLDPRGSRFDQPKMEIPGANYDQRDPKYGTRGPIFEPRDPKFEPRGNFDLRDKYEHHEPKFESRDPKIEHRGPNYNQHDPKYDSRGPKFEPRDPKFESRELKFEPRDTKFGARDDKFKPTFEPVDPSFREREPVKFEVRDPKHSSRDKFDTRDRKFDPREDFKDRREFPHDDMQDRNNRPDRDNRDYQRPDDRNYRDEPGRREEFSRRDDRKDNRQPQDEFQKEFDDIYKRSLEFKQKVQELRRSERDRGDYGRDDRRREPERDDRRKPDDDDYHRDMERHHDDRSSHRPDDRPRSHDDDGPAPDLRRNMAKKRLPPEVKLKRDKAVENIAGKMMEKYGNFEMDSVMKLRVKDDLQVAIAKILFDMFGTKDISFIEMVVKFNAKHDQRSELKIFEDVMSCFPSHVYKAMKRSVQDSDRSDIPAKTSRFSAPDDPHLKAGNVVGNQVHIPDWNLALGQHSFIANNMPMQPFEGVPQLGLPVNPNPMMVPSPFPSQMIPPDNVHIEKDQGFNLYLCKDDFKPFSDVQADILKQFLVTQIFKVTETSHGWAPEFTLKGLQSMFRYEVHTFDEDSKNWLLNFDFSNFQLFSVLVYTKEELWYERAAIWLPGHSGCRHIEPLDKLKLQNKKLEDVCVGKWKLVKKIVNPKGTRIYVDMPPSSARALDKHKMLLSYELQKVNVFLKQIAIDKDAFDAGLQEMSTTDQSVIVAAAKSSPMPVLKEDGNVVKITLKGSKSLSIDQVRKIKEMLIYHMYKYHQQNGPSKTDFLRYGYCPPNSLGLVPENQESKRWLGSIDIGKLQRQPIVIVGVDSTVTRYLKLSLTVPGDHNCNAAIVAERIKQSNQGVKGLNFQLWKPLQVVNGVRKLLFEVEVDLESAETLSNMKFQLDYVDDRQHTKIVQFKPETSVFKFKELIKKYKAELTDSYDVANMDIASESEDDVVCLSE